jgi:hypothetical protein
MHRNNAVIPGEGGDTNRSGKTPRNVFSFIGNADRLFPG